MKKFKSIILASMIAALMVGCASEAPTNETAQNAVASENVAATQYVDTYTSASATKSTLTGAALDEAAAGLMAVSSDLATMADAKVEGYQEPEVAHGQILSVNPDGSVGVSIITGWRYEKNENGNDTVRVELTDGQNAQNLKEVGARGSLIVKTDVNYIVHLKATNVEVIEFTQENFDNGLFNAHYTGADHKASQYNITFEVLAVEKAPLVMFQ